jgi:uncharacterized lipoprotein YddW (UPF0748 family)
MVCMNPHASLPITRVCSLLIIVLFFPGPGATRDQYPIPPDPPLPGTPEFEAGRKKGTQQKSSPAQEQTASEVLQSITPYRRCLWVTRWDYRKKEDIHKIFYNAASIRCTDVFFQVRGEGSVFYPSRIEPWAWELTGSNPGSTGIDPGWDPLKTACIQAKRYGLRIHAYLNVLPAWRHKTHVPPKKSGHVYVIHPDWIMQRIDGKRMSPKKEYAFLDPGLPQVRSYLANLFAEVAGKYPVDGIHLDYIRYPHQQGDYSYTQPVVNDFEKRYSLHPSKRPEAWTKYRREQVTATVKAIADAARQARPGIEVTAAVMADRNRGLNEVFQESIKWVRDGLVDAITPMAYIDQVRDFENLARPYADKEIRDRVWIGIYAEPKKNRHLKEQIERAVQFRFGGIAAFAYNNLFDNHKPNSRARKVYEGFTGK